jgi:hypothetical protein
MPRSRRSERSLVFDLGRLVISYSVDPLDGDHVVVYNIEAPESADAEAVVSAPVEPLRRIQIIG